MHSNFIERIFEGDSEIKISTIKIAIMEASLGNSRDDIRVVVKCFCHLLIATMVFAAGSDRVKWAFVYYIENIENICEFNWCAATLNELISSFNKTQNDLSKLTRCMTLL